MDGKVSARKESRRRRIEFLNPPPAAVYRRQFERMNPLAQSGYVPAFTVCVIAAEVLVR